MPLRSLDRNRVTRFVQTGFEGGQNCRMRRFDEWWYIVVYKIFLLSTLHYGPS